MEPGKPNVAEEANLMFEDIANDNVSPHMNLERIPDEDHSALKKEMRRISVPPHRMTPLKNNWEKITALLVEKMGLLVRMNVQKRCVEIKPSEKMNDTLNMQRSYDFLKSFMLGFELNDAIALLRMDDLYIESFEIKDVRTLNGEHLSRAIGRITGEKGKTKNAIENATKTRIVVADTKIHILGSFSNIKLARDAVSRLIMGSPANKIYNQLRAFARRKD